MYWLKFVFIFISVPFISVISTYEYIRIVNFAYRSKQGSKPVSI